MIKSSYFESGRQTGAALLIGLILLLIMTVLALSSSNVSILQERMAGNVTQINLAFQDAERALREIEQRVAEFADGGSGGLGVIPMWGDSGAQMDLDPFDCSMSSPNSWSWNGTPPWRTAPTTGNDYMVLDLSDYVVGGDLFASACRPVSEVGMGTAGEYFLIVARGESPAGDAEAIVQSIFFWPQ